jgi:hypothetical protein
VTLKKIGQVSFVKILKNYSSENLSKVIIHLKRLSKKPRCIKNINPKMARLYPWELI